MAKAKINVKIEGIEEMLAKFDRFDRESRVAMRKVVRKSANRLRNGMRRRINDVTGDLRKSIGAKYAPDQLSAEVGPTRPLGSHAHLVEFGHRLVVNGQSRGHVPARPFIVPAVEEEKEKYLNDLRSGIRGAIP